MKILHIIDSGGLYGAEVVLLNLVTEQIKLDLDPTIASIGEKGIKEKQLETEALKRGFKIKKFRMLPGPNLYGMLKVLRYAQQNGFDILHSHGYKGNVAFGLMPKRLRKLPLISTLHGWTSVSGFSKNRVYEWLDLISLKYIDAVVLVSEAMRSHPKFKGRRGINFHVIHNGIPISDGESSNLAGTTNTTNSIYPMKFMSMTAKRISSGQTFTPLNSKTIQPGQSTQVTQILDHSIVSFCKKSFTIGSIGRLSHEKGYRYLIEALALLVKENIDARLVIIGEGYERDFLNDLALQFDLSDRVMLNGYLDDAKNYLPYFNLFVLSSLTEGLPITLLEAMHAKIPIVATRVGGIPEVLKNGKNGLLVEPRDLYNLAEALSTIYYNPKLAKDLASVSYQEVVSKYTSETMALQYLHIYQKLDKRNNSTNPTKSISDWIRAKTNLK